MLIWKREGGYRGGYRADTERLRWSENLMDQVPEEAGVFETHSFPSIVSPLFILVSFSLHCPLPQCLLQTRICLTLKY